MEVAESEEEVGVESEPKEKFTAPLANPTVSPEPNENPSPEAEESEDLVAVGVESVFLGRLTIQTVHDDPLLAVWQQGHSHSFDSDVVDVFSGEEEEEKGVVVSEPNPKLTGPL